MENWLLVVAGRHQVKLVAKTYAVLQQKPPYNCFGRLQIDMVVCSLKGDELFSTLWLANRQAAVKVGKM